MYKPLPKCITLEPSEIHGLGLFATQDILPNTCLGITHYFTGFEIIRTPLGGFGNHSDNPNCTKKKSSFVTDFGEIGDKWTLFTNKYISEGEEITWKYDLYSVTQDVKDDLSI
tara:strand:+ start:155 stop:493 length:339 start_codon:yes stop_codon:yes gene_type:complete